MRNKAHKIPKTKAINAIGIELEGGWTRYYTAAGKPIRYHDEGCKIIRNGKPKMLKHDGSVSMDKSNSGCDYVGEIASKPMQPRAITSWVRRNQPDAFNKTCGAHMHVSTKSTSDYMCLTDHKFWKFFREKLAKWGNKQKFSKSHEFWKRLEGNNQYCKVEHTPEKQLHEGSNRYTQINYCWSKHRTLEFRVLPIFETSDLQIEAFFQLIWMVENYLENNKDYKKVWAVKEKIMKFPDGLAEVYEEIIPNRNFKQSGNKPFTKKKQRGETEESLVWNRYANLTIARPLSTNAQKTYFIVTAENIADAPEDIEHVSPERALMMPEIFEDEESDTPVEAGETITRLPAENDVVPATPIIPLPSTARERLLRHLGAPMVDLLDNITPDNAEPIYNYNENPEEDEE